MFSIEGLLKMAGIKQEDVQQILALQNLLSKVPMEKREPIVAKFLKELQEAAGESEDVKEKK